MLPSLEYTPRKTLHQQIDNRELDKREHWIDYTSTTRNSLLMIFKKIVLVSPYTGISSVSSLSPTVWSSLDLDFVGMRI